MWARLALGIFATAIPGWTQPGGDVETGRRLFDSQCALCHGVQGTGGRGPSLRRPRLTRAPDEDTLRTVIAQGIPPEMPASWQLHEREILHVAAYVRSLGSLPQETVPGDPARGEAVYQRSGCGSCHVIDGQGRAWGPELSSVGARRAASHLRASILTPAASLPEGFLLVVAEPLSGPAVTGIRVNEDSFSIQLADPSGRFHSFDKSRLRALRKRFGESPMPAFNKLPAADLDDLVAYLAARRRP